jgi:hypothetical protein
MVLASLGEARLTANLSFAFRLALLSQKIFTDTDTSLTHFLRFFPMREILEKI